VLRREPEFCFFDLYNLSISNSSFLHIFEVVLHFLGRFFGTASFLQPLLSEALSLRYIVKPLSHFFFADALRFIITRYLLIILLHIVLIQEK
jgi:hypothetical protein